MGRRICSTLTSGLVVICTTSTEFKGYVPDSSEVPPVPGDRALRLASRTLEYLWFHYVSTVNLIVNDYGTVQFSYHIHRCNRQEVIRHCCVENQPDQGRYCRYGCSLHRVNDEFRDYGLRMLERGFRTCFPQLDSKCESNRDVNFSEEHTIAI